MKNSIVLLFLILSFLKYGKSQNLEHGLVAHWGFNNDSSHVIFDESENQTHGTSYEIDHVAGIKGKAIQFKSVKDEVLFPIKNGTPPESVGNLSVGSISVWFNFKNVGGKILPILYFGESSENEVHNSLILEIGHGTNGGDPENRRLYFTIINQRFCFDSRENLTPNTWYHFVAVVSATGNTGYLNGEELVDRRYNLGSNSTFHNFFADVPAKEVLSLGYGRFGQDDSFFHFKGMIDEVRIYDRAISSKEVGLLWDEGKHLAGIPNYSNVPYGPFERNILDFWQVESKEPTPLVVFIHGGGFKSGSKEKVYLPDVLQSLNNGISFAAINYRFRETTRLDTIMYDCARAIQFLRTKTTDWNIDKNKIAAYGGSAGGGASLWLGVNNDLADMNASDLILQESSKIQIIGHQTSQASYDFKSWAEIVEVAENWMEIYPNSEDLDLYHINSRDEYFDTEIIELRQLLDMPAHLDETDPPIYLKNLNSLLAPITSGEIIHHPNHAIYLKDMFDKKNIDAYLLIQTTPNEGRKNVIDFFIEKFAEIESGASIINNNTLKIYPNPASEQLKIKTDIKIQQIEIFNIHGRKVYHKTVTNHTNLVSVSNWPSGIYIVKTDTGETKKILIK